MIKVIDLFCGAGGVTSGIEAAEAGGEKCAEVVACVNHDPVAISSHAANHARVKHFTEDIRLLNTSLLPTKAHFPDDVLLLWASLECTNFSNAKGGLPRDADSRTLPLEMFRYVEDVDPDYVYIENVREFMAWGPLDENGKPVSRKKGEDYVAWVQKMCAYGYEYDYRLLNAADYGAYTSRLRYFGVFARKGLPIVFPQPTHAKDPEKVLEAFRQKINGRAKSRKNKSAPVDQATMFGEPRKLSKWKPVREVLDLADEGVSIFGRKKSLSENTHRRILAGLCKYVGGTDQRELIPQLEAMPALDEEGGILRLGGQDTGVPRDGAFITKWMGNDQKSGINNGKSLDEPLNVITTQNRLGIVQCAFLSKAFTGDPAAMVQDVERPCGVITTVDHNQLVCPKFMIQQNGIPDVSNPPFGIDRPARTITTGGGNQSLVCPVFMVQHNGENAESRSASLEDPAKTVTTHQGGKQNLVHCEFLYKYYGSGPNTSSPDDPSGTLTTKDRMACVNLQWMDKGFTGEENIAAIECPAGTLLCKDHQSLCTVRQWLDKMYNGDHNHQPVDGPSGAILTSNHQNLATAKSWICVDQYQNTGTSLDEPVGTVLAGRHWHYILNPQFTSQGHSVERPCPTIIARGDKKPLYLVSTEGAVFGPVPEHWLEKPGDGPTLRLIRRFMRMYGVVDVLMRMLKVPELLRITGFRDGYILHGTQTDQKKFIGNAVPPKVPEAKMAALYSALKGHPCFHSNPKQA